MTDEEIYTTEPVEPAPDPAPDPEPEQAPVEVISVGELLDRLAGEDTQEPEESAGEPAEEEPAEVIDPGPSFQELWDTPIQVIGMDEALRHLRTIVAQTEPHPAMTTDFADYTVSEALLLLLLLSAFMAACIKMLKGGFAWLR
ncbi:MAG: hypothetical protein HFF33_07210 [Oscillospiraceae bacterium]|nr:hypothetical protein [Oscillospiraceae bacterium]